MPSKSPLWTLFHWDGPKYKHDNSHFNTQREPDIGLAFYWKGGLKNLSLHERAAEIVHDNETSIPPSTDHTS